MMDFVNVTADNADEFDFTEAYSKIMAAETKLARDRDDYWEYPIAEEMYGVARQILEFAKAGTVPRSYVSRYGLTRDRGKTIAYESDGAHTNLMSAIVDRALRFRYGILPQFTEDGHAYHSVMEAVRRHDLPENDTGDIPDDGNRDEEAKIRAEREFQAEFAGYSANQETRTDRGVAHLLHEMEGRTSPTGKLLYLADKVSAVIIVLTYDQLGRPPLRRLTDSYLTDRDRQEIALCDSAFGGDAYLASEMWTIDYFQGRSLVEYDDTGWFTALVVAATLLVRQDWYRWREEHYPDSYYS